MNFAMAARGKVSAILGTVLDAHSHPDLAEQERDRAFHRAAIALAVSGIWAIQYMLGKQVQASTWFVVFIGLLSGMALIHRHALELRPTAAVYGLYLFLVLDPLVIVGILVQDPHTFAFLYPVLIVVVVRCGLRYGVRTMYLAWTASLAAVPLLLGNPFFRNEAALTASLVLMLLLVPVLFHSLIRRIHNVRAIETERARLAALHEASAARSAFLSKVSHELRSPLQGIVSALDLIEMRHGHLQASDADLVARMRRSSLLLNTQLRDLLTLARGEAGRLEVNPEPFEATALVEALVDGARELANASELELTVGLPDGPIFVIADAARIDQVLTNLLINSIRYTEKGQVRVTLHPYDAAARRLRFSVADTGPGIPEAALPTLFVPDKTLAGDERRGKGSGLGLAIVRTLVDLLGGTIAVTSHLGKGTTFKLEVPAEPVEKEDSAEPLEHATQRVLVVDDRQDVLDALTSVIDELGFECDRAASTAVAANLLASRRYDIVVFDVEMPVKSGVELAAETRRGSGPNARSRFIGISAAAGSMAPGETFDAVLAKPVDHAALRQALTGGAYLSRPSQPGLWLDEA